MLHFADGTPFAIGAAPYAYRPATDLETSPRIILTVQIGDIETSGLVDTGGVYLICSPEIAEIAGIDIGDGIPAQPLLWRGMRLHGVLQRVDLLIPAAAGIDVRLEATAFIPQSNLDLEWDEDFPCVLGMFGCLERLRFAVDPDTDTFFFGELGEANWVVE